MDQLEMLKYAPLVGCTISWFAGVVAAFASVFAVSRSVR